ncbi:MAG: integrase, partial [Spirochaetaceae bacterium]|nr:integrase [Spirochaetaceae bacterium]
MRAKQAFSLYCRKLSSGKTVWYYQTYDEDGLRTAGKSTGKSTKTAAREYCNALMRAGKLLPSAQFDIPTFREFAAGWWEYETCA